jgi:hypothetical protein
MFNISQVSKPEYLRQQIRDTSVKVSRPRYLIETSKPEYLSYLSRNTSGIDAWMSQLLNMIHFNKRPIDYRRKKDILQSDK